MILFLPLLHLIGNICIAGLQLFDLCSLALDVGAVLLVNLLQRAAQLLCGFQILTQFLHIVLSRHHRFSLGLNIEETGDMQFKICQICEWEICLLCG